MKSQTHGSQSSAGFPSPADDHLEQPLDLNNLLIRNRLATFYLRVSGDEMACDGVANGDLIIVDRSLEPVLNKIVVVAINGDLVLRRVAKQDGRMGFNSSKDPNSFESFEDYEIWGVATNVVRPL